MPVPVTVYGSDKCCVCVCVSNFLEYAHRTASGHAIFFRHDFSLYFLPFIYLFHSESECSSICIETHAMCSFYSKYFNALLLFGRFIELQNVECQHSNKKTAVTRATEWHHDSWFEELLIQQMIPFSRSQHSLMLIQS